VKKKLAAIDMKIQVAIVVIGLLLIGFAAHTLVVSPQNKKASDVAKQVADTELQIQTRKLAANHQTQAPPIKVADLFRLSKAMPDREDMPGIILTISQVARESGIHFNTIEPQDIGPPPVGNYRMRKIHLTFNGDFYALSDFLYRLRNLVTVHNGRLETSGRLFTVQNVTFSLGTNTFPAIAADITVDAYMYGIGPAVAAPATGTDTTSTTGTDTTSTSTTGTTSTTPSTDTATPPDATAVGTTP
jgi:Tfp pilus assembly protein PilO